MSCKNCGHDENAHDGLPSVNWCTFICDCKQFIPQEEDFILSDKRVNPYSDSPYKAYILVTDVKEFIRLLKEENINKTGKTLIISMGRFNELAGDLK